MTDSPEPTAPDSSASPYGPSDGVEQLFGEVGAPTTSDSATVTPAPSPTTGDSEPVARARRSLRRLAISLPIAGLTLSIAAITVQITTGGVFGTDPVSEIAGFSLTFLGPTLLVLGLHMIVWRAMVRPLSRMSPGNRVGMIIGVGGVLSFLSVILVFVLIFAGFMLVSLLLSASDQAL